MSLEAIERVKEAERRMRECMANAEAEAHRMVADAEEAGLAQMRHVRADGLEQGKILLKQAEEKAARRAAEIRTAAEAESAALRQAAEARLEDAAEFIVGRVVNH